MPAELERVVDEAIAMAAQRSGTLVALTVSARAATDELRALAHKLLAKRGAGGADFDVVVADGPVRLVSIEVRRLR